MNNVISLKRRRSRVKIDLKKPDDFTLEKVRRLIASGNDRTYNQICVTNAGIVYLRAGCDPPPAKRLAFQFEGYVAGNGYVGPTAAQDTEWVKRVYRALARNWPEVEVDDYIDYY